MADTITEFYSDTIARGNEVDVASTETSTRALVKNIYIHGGNYSGNIDVKVNGNALYKAVPVSKGETVKFESENIILPESSVLTIEWPNAENASSGGSESLGIFDRTFDDPSPNINDYDIANNPGGTVIKNTFLRFGVEDGKAFFFHTFFDPSRDPELDHIAYSVLNPDGSFFVEWQFLISVNDDYQDGDFRHRLNDGQHSYPIGQRTDDGKNNLYGSSVKEDNDYLAVVLNGDPEFYSNNPNGAGPILIFFDKNNNYNIVHQSRPTDNSFGAALVPFNDGLWAYIHLSSNTLTGDNRDLNQIKVQYRVVDPSDNFSHSSNYLIFDRSLVNNDTNWPSFTWSRNLDPGELFVICNLRDYFGSLHPNIIDSSGNVSFDETVERINQPFVNGGYINAKRDFRGNTSSSGVGEYSFGDIVADYDSENRTTTSLVWQQGRDANSDARLKIINLTTMTEDANIELPKPRTDGWEFPVTTFRSGTATDLDFRSERYGNEINEPFIKIGEGEYIIPNEARYNYSNGDTRNIGSAFGVFKFTIKESKTEPLSVFSKPDSTGQPRVPWEFGQANQFDPETGDPIRFFVNGSVDGKIGIFQANGESGSTEESNATPEMFVKVDGVVTND